MPKVRCKWEGKLAGVIEYETGVLESATERFEGLWEQFQENGVFRFVLPPPDAPPPPADTLVDYGEVDYSIDAFLGEIRRLGYTVEGQPPPQIDLEAILARRRDGGTPPATPPTGETEPPSA